MSTLADQLRRLLAPADRVVAQPPPDADARAAAVLVPLVEGDEPSLVFTKRTEELPRHPGEISFPGGLRHGEDADLLETALRESEEELGLARADVDVLGALPSFLTYTTGFWVTPFVGALHRDPRFTPNAGEIAEVLEFPVATLDAIEREMEWRRPNGEVWHGFIYEIDGHTIWGATARMLHEFLELTRKEIPWAEPA